MHPDSGLARLIDTLPQAGAIEWIGVRPARGEPMIAVASAQLLAGKGLVGDRFKGRFGSARQVTLIQQEHLLAIAGFLHCDMVAPESVRRNIVVSGLNLLALKNKRFAVGESVMEYSGLAHPCSKMEAALGPVGYNAMRGHGGITARVISGGVINIGESLVWQDD